VALTVLLVALTVSLVALTVLFVALTVLLDCLISGLDCLAGFGLGFDRLVLFATGLENIRDVAAYPCYAGHAAA
jgi:aspartyl/asparaginyl-tRNA synthetase